MNKRHIKSTVPTIQFSVLLVCAALSLFSSVQLRSAETSLRNLTGGGCPCGNGSAACSQQDGDTGPARCSEDDECAITCSADTSYSCNGQGVSKNCKTDSYNCETTPSDCVGGQCQDEPVDPNNDACGARTYCASK